MNSVLPWLWVSLAIGLTAASHITFKLYSTTPKAAYAAATIVGFLLTPLFSLLALRTLTIAQLYLCVAFVPAITTMGARFLIKEQIDWRHLVGLALTIGGVIAYQTAP